MKHCWEVRDPNNKVIYEDDMESCEMFLKILQSELMTAKVKKYLLVGGYKNE